MAKKDDENRAAEPRTNAGRETAPEKKEPEQGKEVGPTPQEQAARKEPEAPRKEEVSVMGYPLQPEAKGQEGHQQAPAKEKIGAGHVGSMFRKGAQELGQYLPAFNNAGTHITEDQGIWPNKTPGEIADDRGFNNLDANQEKQKSVMGYPLAEAAQADKALQQERGQEQSRGRGR